MQTELVQLLKDRQLVDDEIRRERLINARATFAKMSKSFLVNTALITQLLFSVHVLIHAGNKIRADDQLDLLEVQLGIDSL